jgi:hypothetical protein
MAAAGSSRAIYDAGGNALGGEIVIASKASGGFGGSSVTRPGRRRLSGQLTNTHGTSTENQLSAQAMGANDAPFGGPFDVSAGAPFPASLYSDGAANARQRPCRDYLGRTEHRHQRRRLLPGLRDQHGRRRHDHRHRAGDYFDLSQGGNDMAQRRRRRRRVLFRRGVHRVRTQCDGGAGSNDQIGLQGDYTGGQRAGARRGTIAKVEVLAVLPGFDYRSPRSMPTCPRAAAADLCRRPRAGDNLTFNGSAETDGTFKVFGGLGADLSPPGRATTGSTSARASSIRGRPGRRRHAGQRPDGARRRLRAALDGTAIKNIDVIALLPGIAATLPTTT